MSEPVYDEDFVNLGYLKRIVEEFEENSLPDNVSRHYGSRPNPPYYKGDTWIDGSIVYTCINTRTIGMYADSDWVTESGAKAEAERKNKTYTSQPSNYSVRDMWILQSDNDHEAGKKGEILLTTVGRSTYNADDWVSMLEYTKLKTYYSTTAPSEANVGDIWIDTSNNNQMYRYNGTNWTEAYDTRVNEIKQNLDTVTERTVTISDNLGEISQTVSELATTTDTLTEEIESINEEVSNIRQTQNSWIADFKKIGGNNLFYYDLDLWNSYSGLVEYTNTEIKNNSISGMGYLVNSGTSKQDITVSNGTYTVSFKYKKIGTALSQASVKINGTEYSLEETEWTNFSQTLDVTTNHLEFEITADTNETLYIADLMGNLGTEADVWTQNPNEVRTDTVKIGKGIEVSSSSTDTKLKADADGVRVVQASNESNVVAEFTDKGIRTKELECERQAQISGILIQQVGNQTWISSLL